MRKEVRENPPKELLNKLSSPGVVLVYGPENSGKSTFVMYIISRTISPKDKVLLYDSSNAIEVFRRLGPKVGEEFTKRVFRIRIKDWHEQKRWVRRIGLLPKEFKKVVFDEFTSNYLSQLFKMRDDIKRYMRLHRELIFQIAYLRYLSQNLDKTIFLVTRERSTGDPLGGLSLKKIASIAVRLDKTGGDLFRLEVESEGDQISKIIFRLDP